MKHTKGPWKFERIAENTFRIRTVGEGSFRKITTIDKANATDRANAQLIASAPDLLKALEYALTILKMRADAEIREKGTTFIVLKNLESAIAKAKGEGHE